MAKMDPAPDPDMNPHPHQGSYKAGATTIATTELNTFKTISVFS
jgi:hypothetical protein